MLNNSKNGLAILDFINQDYKLPKFKKEENTFDSKTFSKHVEDGSVDFDRIASPQISMAMDGGSWVIPATPNEGEIKVNIFVILWRRFMKWCKPNEPKPKISISDFFKAIKTTSVDLEDYSERANNYINALKHAKQLNQNALVQDLQLKINEVRYESILYAGNFRTIITEEQVVKFYKESPKGLNLCYISQFIKIIPEKASRKKAEADKLLVFDNYVILHYDPDKKAYKEEKDPILFGVIKGIRKLYYIADWVDEYCDLTLDQFIQKFGDEAIKINDISVNIKLPNK